MNQGGLQKGHVMNEMCNIVHYPCAAPRFCCAAFNLSFCTSIQGQVFLSFNLPTQSNLMYNNAIGCRHNGDDNRNSFTSFLTDYLSLRSKRVFHQVLVARCILCIFCFIAYVASYFPLFGWKVSKGLILALVICQTARHYDENSSHVLL